MKVLIVSHNALGSDTNMGKTLCAWFQDFAPDELAQFYIREEAPPDGKGCRNSWRFTDMEALRALCRCCPQGSSSRSGGAPGQAGYRYGRKRTALGYLLRDLLWKYSPWKNPQFWQWIRDFDPDVVFLASGDYGFLYDVAVEMAEAVGKPLVVACVDDFYLYDRWKGSLLGPLARRMFRRSVFAAMNRAGRVFAICPAMAEAYEALFARPCRVLYTPAKQWDEPGEVSDGPIVYLGNVSLKRAEQLIQIGRTLQALDIPGVPNMLRVYSGERDPGMRAGLTAENGICFCGSVGEQQAWQILQTSMAAIHTESFDPALGDRLRFSISTKIPEILSAGPCLIAYGPAGIASMDYLQENGGAYTILRPEDLEAGLKRILTDAALRREIRCRGRHLAEENHRPGRLRWYLEELCGEYHENSTN